MVLKPYLGLRGNALLRAAVILVDYTLRVFLLPRDQGPVAGRDRRDFRVV